MLVVNNFAIWYTAKTDVNHLLSVLCQHYQLMEDWEASQYCGMTLAWDYEQHTVDISMPSYIERTLKCF